MNWLDFFFSSPLLVFAKALSEVLYAVWSKRIPEYESLACFTNTSAIHENHPKVDSVKLRIPARGNGNCLWVQYHTVPISAQCHTVSYLQQVGNLHPI
ncbi:hypothetical protein HOY80DRAFT_613375 [Tuber brumale]|nr:hypothetical protein HOY80DRAFT_613375 [Tuber brumale]